MLFQKTSVFIILDTEHLNVNFPVSGDEDAPLPAAQIRKDNSIEETEDALSDISPSELPDIQELLRTSQKHKVVEEELKGLKLVSLPSARAQDLERTFKSN